MNRRPPNLQYPEPTASDIRQAIKQRHIFDAAIRARDLWAAEHAKDPKRQIILKSVATHPATPERAAELLEMLKSRTA